MASIACSAYSAGSMHRDARGLVSVCSTVWVTGCRCMSVQMHALQCAVHSAAQCATTSSQHAVHVVAARMGRVCSRPTWQSYVLPLEQRFLKLALHAHTKVNECEPSPRKPRHSNTADAHCIISLYHYITNYITNISAYYRWPSKELFLLLYPGAS